MKIKIKKTHSEAQIPKYAKQGDAGMDLTAVSAKLEGAYIEYDTGLQFEIPAGFVGLLFPRSSLSKIDLLLSNHVGVLDSGYRGNVTFRFKPTHNSDFLKWYKVGDRIGQIIILPYPQIEFQEVNELSESERGSGGYGSTGK